MGLLATLVLNAAVADDVEFNAVADDVAGDVAAQGMNQAFNRSGAELADITASDADGVMVVLNAGQAVLGGAIHEVQPADNAGLHQELDRPEDGCPAHPWQLTANLLSGKSFLLPFQDTNNSASGSSRTIASIFESGHDVRACSKRDIHGTQYQYTA